MPVGGDSEGRTPGGDSRPTPDPTSLTTEQLDKGLKALDKVIESRIDGLEKLVEQRFTLIEQQRLEQKTDTKAAVDAALIAQKEAVKEQTNASDRAIAKSEAATSKQLEQLSATFTTAIGGVNVTLSDVKERVGRIENIKTGGQQTMAGLYMLAGFIVLIIAIIGGIVAFQAGGP